MQTVILQSFEYLWQISSKLILTISNRFKVHFCAFLRHNVFIASAVTTDDLKIEIKNHDFLSESAKIEITIFAKSLLRLFLQQLLDVTGLNDLKIIGKGFYRKWLKSSFEQFITTQSRKRVWVAEMDE